MILVGYSLISNLAPLGDVPVSKGTINVLSLEAREPSSEQRKDPSEYSIFFEITLKVINYGNTFTNLSLD